MNSRIALNLYQIETAMKCLEEEGIYHYRDTLGYALYMACVASPSRNNAMLLTTLEYAVFWAKVNVGSSDPRVIDLEKRLQAHRQLYRRFSNNMYT
jgi:hypothetical protein